MVAAGGTGYAFTGVSGAADVAEATVWRISSGVGLLPSLYFGSASVRTVLANAGERQRRRSTATLIAINGPLLIICAIQVWNIVTLGEFWPVLLLLVALFAIGCFAFVRLLFAEP